MTRAQDKQRKQFEGDIIAMLKHAPSVRIIGHLLDIAGLYQRSYSGDPTDAVHRDGRRSLALDFIALINSVDPAAYPAMLTATVVERERKYRADKREDTDA